LAGLSDKVSSDMHNYYSVLGDIYEKYNQPGKQMAPEMRLLLMLSGAALSMQVNKVTGLGNIGNITNIKNDEETVKELRKKAEADSVMKDNEYIKKQHDAATQKAVDLKMIQEKELEYQRVNKLLDEKNTNMQKFKENLILSSESPRDKVRKGTNKEKNKQEVHKEQEDDNDHQCLTQEEINHITKMKYMEEQKHLELMRQMAHKKSEMFRNNNSDQNDKRKRDLDRQNKQLDDILASVDIDKKKKVTRKSDDVKSVGSTASTVSTNPRLKSIMKETSNLVNKDADRQIEKMKKQSGAQKKLKKNDSETIDFAEPIGHASKGDKYDTSEIKLDTEVQKLIENDDSDIGKISKDEISVGSRNKNTSQNKTSELIDFGAISFGSKNKGSKPTLNIGGSNN